jgi:alpha-D-ribose 1-methylphosphonate 5-triphosphate diphosphatase
LQSLQLIVYNENIPGQRQFTLEQHVSMVAMHEGISKEEAMHIILRRISEVKGINHRAAIYAAGKGKFIFGSHDDTTVQHILEAQQFGATLSEMPTTIEAARKAKEMGLWVCMGAPNYYRGGSHCGNLSCAEAMEEGLVDMLCSDYHFPTMLASLIRLITQGAEPSRAVNLVSLNPARMLGFDKEIGSIEVGKRADLVAFTDKHDYACVTKVFVEGENKFSASYQAPLTSLSTEKNLAFDGVEAD